MNRSESVIRVRYAETDQMSVAYHGALIPWFEVGRTDWLREHIMPYSDLEKQHQVHLAVVEANLNYKRRILYDDEIKVVSSMVELGKSRLKFDYQLFRDAELCATGFTTHVCVDRDGNPVRWPFELHKKMKSIMGQNE